MKCLNCGTVNSPTALKCTNCNVPLTGSMVLENKKHTNAASGLVVCKNCKSTNPADALKCHQCNAPLEGSMVMDNSAPKTKGYATVVCKNCKTTNPADALKCIQCNAPLEGSMVLERTSNPPPSKEKIDKQTVSIAIERPAQSGNTCPSCSYPNQAKASVCVQCGTTLAKTPIAVTESAPKTAERQEPKTTGRKKLMETVNPWMDQPHSKAFKLTPLQPDMTEKSAGKEFTGESITLKRDDLEAGNNTITSGGQVRLTCTDGQWTVEDISSMQTSFVKIKGKQALNDGDVLLLGNRLFRFESK